VTAARRVDGAVSHGRVQITPADRYYNRREFIASLAAAGAVGSLALARSRRRLSSIGKILE
jgi:hypothetical protein